MSDTFNITPKRIQALRFIGAHPGCLVGYVAQEVLVGDYKPAGGRSLWSQQATRAGAGYCQKLRDAGLITINTYVDCGYGKATLTEAGQAALDEIDAQAASLDAVVARCIK